METPLRLYGNVVESIGDNFLFMNSDCAYNFSPFHFLVHVLQKEKVEGSAMNLLNILSHAFTR